jgi:hypothetical protein
MNVFELSALVTPIAGVIGAIAAKPHHPVIAGTCGLIVGLGIFFFVITSGGMLLKRSRWQQDYVRDHKKRNVFQSFAEVYTVFGPMLGPFIAILAMRYLVRVTGL